MQWHTYLEGRPAVKGHVARAIDAPQVAHSTGEEGVPGDGLDGDDHATDLDVPRGGAEAFAEGEAEHDGSIGVERGKAIDGLLVEGLRGKLCLAWGHGASVEAVEHRGRCGGRRALRWM